jgi:hypothetical protein
MTGQRYTSLLYPLYKQQALLLRLNADMPEGLRVPEAQIEALDTASAHVQSTKDLECFFVVRSTLEETWRFNRQLIKLTQPAIQDSGEDSQLRLHETARDYEEGIYRIRLNLIDHWVPGKKRSVDGVREGAVATGKLLAGIEAIGAYGLQDPELFQAQDGKTLPYCDLAGLQQGSFVPGFSYWWCGWGREARFGVHRTDEVTAGRAVPSLVEC